MCRDERVNLEVEELLYLRIELNMQRRAAPNSEDPETERELE